MNQHRIGLIQILLASLLFGFNGVFGKAAFASGITVGELLTFRFFLAACILWTGVLLFNPKLAKLPRYNIALALVMGILGYAVFATLYFTAIKGLSIALAALLLYTYPFWTGIIEHFLGEPMPLRRWACMAGAMAGLALLLWGAIDVRSGLSLIAGLGCAITYAGYIIFSARFQKNVSSLASGLYVITGAAIALQAFHAPNWAAWERYDRHQFLIIAGLAVFGTVFALVLVQASLQKLKSVEVSLLAMVEPVTAAIAGWAIFDEALSARQLAGLLLVLACLALDAWKGGPRVAVTVAPSPTSSPVKS